MERHPAQGDDVTNDVDDNGDPINGESTPWWREVFQWVLLLAAIGGVCLIVWHIVRSVKAFAS
jgi:hypothetical protein